MTDDDDQHTTTTVEITSYVQDPLDDITDDDHDAEGFQTALRQRLGTASTDELDASFSAPQSGGVWVEFDDGPTVKFDLEDLFMAARDAAWRQGFLVDQLGPRQPDWIEVSTTMYDCGECGYSFLDRIYMNRATRHQTEHMACPDCGWIDFDPASDLGQNDWICNRYPIHEDNHDES